MSNIGNALPRELIADASQGHLQPIKEYLERNKKFKIDTRDMHGRTLLIYATKADHVDLVKFLLDKGSSLEVKDHEDQTALIYAADRGLLEIVKLLIERKANIDNRDKEGKTALIYATIGNRMEVVKFLLESGANSNIVDAYGRAAVSYATYKKLAVLKPLLEFNANPNIIETDGNSPLMNACRKANYDHVKQLLDHKADPNLRQQDGTTALLHAAWYCQKDILEALIKAGADLNVKDNRGISVVQYASQANNKAAVDYLSEQILQLPVDQRSVETTTGQIESGKDKQSFVPTACSDEEIQQALRTGKKPWGRSKIMIVGEGRAGKTALANSIQGKTFQQTSSTIGIQSVSCNVEYGNADTKSWQTAHQAEQHLESAVASMIANNRNNRPVVQPKQAAPISIPNSSNSQPTVCLDESDSKTSKSAKAAEDPESLITNATAEANHEIAEQVEEIINPISSVNQDVVMKCLSNDLNVNCKYNVSLYDFGGQSVFNVIHPFFLSRYGIYLICFNMEWLINPRDPEEYHRALTNITFWLNSIIIHTQDTAGHLPPIAFVGTRKDVITNVSAHEAISTLLYETFSNSIAWPYIIENSCGQGKDGQVNLFFFPINNVLGRDDPTLQHLLSSIEHELDQAHYVHEMISLAWLQSYDFMMKTSQAFLSLSVVEQITKQCGIPLKKIPVFLHFLHQMGMIMWHDEPSLRHIVILNPIEYFVVPTTIVICKHEPTIADSTYHSLAIHKKVRKFHKREWDQMVKFGIISQKILYALLEGYATQDIQMLIQLMLKYGLIVKVHSSLAKEDSAQYDNTGISRTASLEEQQQLPLPSLQVQASITGNDRSVSVEEEYEVQQYLAPALLPIKVMEDHLQDHRTVFYFLFTTSEQLDTQTLFNFVDCKQYGFLPNGWFERIISQAISWSQQTTSLELLHMQLYAIAKDDVTLAFGNQLFRMKLLPSHHLIEVTVEGKSPIGIYVRLREQIKHILTQQQMKKLQFVTLLPYIDDMKSPRAAAAAGGVNGSHHGFIPDQERLLLRLSEIQHAMERHSVLSLAGGKGRKMLSNQDIDTLYSGWLDQYHRFDAYDVFFSYRWNTYDSHIVQAIFDRLSLYTITSEFRAIRSFLDLHKLEKGISFQTELAKGLVHSTIIVPLISCEALQRCIHHDSNHVDNLLLEWILALACVRTLSPETTHVRRMIPLLVGSTAHDMVSNLFKEDVLNKLPTVTPTATALIAKDLLRGQQVLFNEHDVMSMTVKDIVEEMLRHLGIEVWTVNESVNYNQRHLIVNLSEKLKEELENVVAASQAGSNSQKQAHRRGSVTESIKANLKNAHLSSLVSNEDNLTMNKDLSTLSIHEVEILYVNIGLGMYTDEVQKNALDGEALVQCKTEDDLKEAGVTKAFHARKLLNYIDSWQKDGVPRQLLVERSSI